MVGCIIALFGFSCPQPELIELTNHTAVRIERSANYNLVPKDCLKHREKIEELADLPARRAALMEQESSCNPLAKSKYANGIYQITPKTGRGLARGLCRDLGPYQPFDVEWAIPCALRLLKKETAGNYTLDGIRTGEQRYNGGYWVVWEKKQAEINGLSPTINNAKKFCGTLLYNGRKRAKWACDENYSYPVHIERRLPKYESYKQRNEENI